MVLDSYLLRAVYFFLLLCHTSLVTSSTLFGILLKIISVVTLILVFSSA